MPREMGVQEEMMRLMKLRSDVDARIQELRSGGVPMGARPGMGQNVGPDRPPMNVPEPVRGLLV